MRKSQPLPNLVFNVENDFTVFFKTYFHCHSGKWLRKESLYNSNHRVKSLSYIFRVDILMTVNSIVHFLSFYRSIDYSTCIIVNNKYNFCNTKCLQKHSGVLNADKLILNKKQYLIQYVFKADVI